MASCIYCPSDADGTEHWLPRSLGTLGPCRFCMKRYAANAMKLLANATESSSELGRRGFTDRVWALREEMGKAGILSIIELPQPTSASPDHHRL